MLKLHYSSNSRAQRILWLLKELKLSFELNHIKFHPSELKSEEHRKRHPLGRVFTISHYSLLRIKEYELSPTNKNNSPSAFASEAKWHNVNRIGELAFDHNKILAACKEKLVNHVKSKPVGFELLPNRFTLSELQNLYESILEKKFDKRNFRKN